MRIREGVLLRNVCGEWLLIAVGDAARHCMYVRQINDTLAYYWQMIEEGKTEEEIITAAREEYDASPEVIEKDVRELIRQLYDMNYLVGPAAIDPEKGVKA
ncbi:MAG: PqqD family protein [Lachnospiraceae bacterium]|nr:PqqD family protein [Lachnospiraceae bacterium]